MQPPDRRRPNDVGLTWMHEDLLKAQGNKQYLPFSVSIDPTKIAGNKVTFYWRVVAKDAPAPPRQKPRTRRRTIRKADVLSMRTKI